MTNTAISAGGKSTRTITFKNEAHKKFYMEYLQKCRYQDVYHKALVYCLGLNSDTRDHVDRIYDFKEGYVKPECLYEGWQTGVGLARMGQRVLLVDSDPQGHLTLGLGFPKNIRVTLKNMMENIIMGIEFDPREAVLHHGCPDRGGLFLR